MKQAEHFECAGMSGTTIVRRIADNLDG